MTPQEFLPQTNLFPPSGLRRFDGAPCAAYPGVPCWPDLGERKGYSGSGTGLNRCTVTRVPLNTTERSGGRTIVMHRTVNNRLHLTEIRHADRAAFLEHLNDGDIHRFTCRIPYPYTNESFDEWIGIVTAAAEEYGEPINWAIRDPNENLIGGVGFDNLIKGHRAEIGYWLAKPYWGQGIMSMVVRKACEIAVTEWELARITAIVFQDNLASVRVLEKNGFAPEARLKKYFKRDGLFSDAFLLRACPE